MAGVDRHRLFRSRIVVARRPWSLDAILRWCRDRPERRAVAEVPLELRYARIIVEGVEPCVAPGARQGHEPRGVTLGVREVVIDVFRAGLPDLA